MSLTLPKKTKKNFKIVDNLASELESKTNFLNQKSTLQNDQSEVVAPKAQKLTRVVKDSRKLSKNTFSNKAVKVKSSKLKNTPQIEVPQSEALPEKSANSGIVIKKPPFLFAKTQEQLANLSRLLDCPVLSYFKPPSGVIWGQDLYAILECLKTIGPQKKLALYIRSSGGQGMVSLRIINLLRSFADKLILLAPLECASAATMLALGCDEIFMGPLSSLSPVDSSLTHSLSPVDSLNNKVPISLDELWRVLRLWQDADKNLEKFGQSPAITKLSSQNLLESSIDNSHNSQTGAYVNRVDLRVQESDYSQNLAQISTNPTDFSQNPKNSKLPMPADKSLENPYKYLYQYVHPLVFGAVDRHSSLSLQICKEIMSYHLTDEALIDKINHKLNYDYPAHGYPITAREAKKLGLNVLAIEPDMQNILNQLQLLYSEMTEEKITDYDNLTFHDNSIYSITETEGVQITYQQNYDKFYRETEKRYITINDQSGWFKTKRSLNSGKTKNSKSGKISKSSTKFVNESTTEQIFF